VPASDSLTLPPRRSRGRGPTHDMVSSRRRCTMPGRWSFTSARRRSAPLFGGRHAERSRVAAEVSLTSACGFFVGIPVGAATRRRIGGSRAPSMRSTGQRDPPASGTPPDSPSIPPAARCGVSLSRCCRALAAPPTRHFPSSRRVHAGDLPTPKMSHLSFKKTAAHGTYPGLLAGREQAHACEQAHI
jgi:hypothetical protein